MTKNKLYIIVISGLLLSNLLLIFFAFHKPKPPKNRRHPDPRTIIIEKLHFDAQQIKQYDALISPHQKEIKTQDSAIQVLKNKLYLLLASAQANTAKKDSLIIAISVTQRKIEHIHYNHFLGIRQICKPEQIPQFNALSHEISSLFSPTNRRRK